jgi:uncharacterized protein
VTELAVVVAIVFVGALTRSLFGFGDAAVAMPLLALLAVGIETAVPLVGLVGLTVAAVAVRQAWAGVDRAALLRLSAATALGVPFGVVLVRFASERALTASLGVLLVVNGITMLARSGPRRALGASWAYPFGYAAGALGSAYNLNGVPVAVFGALRGWHPERFRGTLQAHFLVSSVLVVAGQGLGGLWTWEVARLYGWSLPAVLLAGPLGHALHRRVPADSFGRLVSLAIAALGILLLLP